MIKISGFKESNHAEKYTERHESVVVLNRLPSDSLFRIIHAINDRENLGFRQNGGKLFRPFGPHDQVVRPVIVEDLVEKEFKSVARDVNITVAKTGLDADMEVLFEFIRRDLGCRLVEMCFQHP